MKWIPILVMLLFMAVMIFASTGLSDLGNPEAPANTHISPDYIEDSVHDTHTPNIVTSVLADYRGYDTLGETVVIFTAGLACLLVLTKRNNDDNR